MVYSAWRVLVLSKAARLSCPSQTIFTRANDHLRPKVQRLGTWTDRIKRWTSQGQDSDSSNTKTSEGKERTKSSDSSVDETEATLKARDKQVKELQDKYLRALAETENVRQRLSKQVDEARMFGIQGFAKDLLDVADILEKANDSISAEDLASENKTLQVLIEGMKLTETELQKVFQRNGLKKVDGKGNQFDPTVHEALFEVPGDKPGTVAVVSRYGYLLHNRTLRPARVGVFKAKT